MQAVKEAKVQEFTLLFLVFSWLHQGNHLCLLKFQRAHWLINFCLNTFLDISLILPGISFHNLAPKIGMAW